MGNCNCNLKNSHYKSSSEFYNTATQAVGAAVTPLALTGSEITDTGVSICMQNDAIRIEHSGLYRIHGCVNFNATTAGSVTAQMYLNGLPMAETVRISTVSVGNNLIQLDTVRSFRTMCGQTPQNIQFMIVTDGTAAGSVTFVSGNVVKEA